MPEIRNAEQKRPILIEYSSVACEIIGERVVNEVKGEKELDVKVKWQDIVINGNNRRYPRGLLEREITRTTKKIGDGNTVWGMPFHPADGFGKTNEISHMWNKLWMESDGVCKGELTLLSTPEGMTLQTLVKKGKLGISSRGFGTTTEKTELINGKEIKFLEVNDDYKMITPGDFVPEASVEGAGNITEVINDLESRLNKDLDSNKENTNVGEDTMTLKDLKEKYPELVKQIEDEKEAALKVEADKTTGVKITELETKVSEKDTKIKELEDEGKVLKEWKSSTLKGIREFISTASEIDGVLPEDIPGDDPDPTVDKAEAELIKANKELGEAKETITTLEAKDTKRVEDEKKATDTAKLQTELRTKMDEVLKKDEFKAYADFVEKKLVDEDGKITIESVDVVEDAVKTAFTDITDTAAAVEKAKIVKDTGEKGVIENPEGGDKAGKEQIQELRALYQQARLAGFVGGFEEWKKEFPQIVETVK